MVPDPSMTSLGMNIAMKEMKLNVDQTGRLGKREIEKVGLAKAEDVIDGCVFRVEKSYPVYDSNYATHLAVIRSYLDTLENFQTIGRNGLHRYNNQDHAMLTGMLAVRNILHNEKNDLWTVNAEQEYHEEIWQVEENHLQTILNDAFSRAFPDFTRFLWFRLRIVTG
jgi:protoporphyrinogen oxidase